jgi:hypothetical protein
VVASLSLLLKGSVSGYLPTLVDDQKRVAWLAAAEATKGCGAASCACGEACIVDRPLVVAE